MEQMTPFSIDFHLLTGKSAKAQPTLRYVSDMRSQFANLDAAQAIIAQKDALLYEFYELDIPETAGDVKFGTSIVYPGKVGNEYFMTKGHFHTILDTAEVYYCLRGKGLMLMETPEGGTVVQPLLPGNSLYVPGRYAHRSINVGDEPLVTFFAFRADAGHDYGSIEKKGYRKLVVEQDGSPTLVDNPKWQ